MKSSLFTCRIDVFNVIPQLVKIFDMNLTVAIIFQLRHCSKKTYSITRRIAITTKTALYSHSFVIVASPCQLRCCLIIIVIKAIRYAILYLFVPNILLWGRVQTIFVKNNVKMTFRGWRVKRRDVSVKRNYLCGVTLWEGRGG